MQEFYVDTANTLTLDVYVNNTLADPDAGVVVDIINVDTGTIVVSGAPTTNDAVGKYSYVLSPPVTNDTGFYVARWHYDVQGVAYSPATSFTVSVPYVTLEDFTNYPSLADKSNEVLWEMERIVRYVIDSFCGQTFQYKLDRSLTVHGKDSNWLVLPERLWNLDSVKVGVDYVDTADIEGHDITELVYRDLDDFWRIRRRNYYSFNEIKRDVEGEFRRMRYFGENKIYVVTGDWGWEYVPGEVNQAARLLVDYYFCKDATYRDKWIDNIRSADWRIEYDRTGSETTGSANADMMLANFKNPGMVVI